MPNWCNNGVVLTGTTEQVDALESALAAAAKEQGPGLLSYFVPEPEGLGEGWYDWRLDNWGCKWEVAVDAVHRRGNSLTLVFDSAWAPPVEVYEAMHKQGWDVVACYWEPGMCFAGEWVNGHDLCIEYDGMELDSIGETLPACDEMFDMVESLKVMRSHDNDEEV